MHAPNAADLRKARPLADAKDVPIMAAAIGSHAPMLVTHNTRHFKSGSGVRIIRPRLLVEQARAWMCQFGG